MSRDNALGVLLLALAALVVGYPRPAEVPAPKPPAPSPATQPGDGAAWTPFPVLRQKADAGLPAVLADVCRHIPPAAGETYRSADLGNWCHEGLHGANAAVRNQFGRPGLYLGGDRCVLLTHPAVTIGQVAAKVPAAFRNFQYQTYCVGARRDWDRQPLYLWDEWSAYVFGARCEREAGKGKGRAGTLAEYLPVALAVALAADLGAQEREVLALLLRWSSAELKAAGAGNDTTAKLKTGSEGASYREALARLYGGRLKLEDLLP